MFVGHYGVSFAAKSVEKTLPLWLLFVAVQIVDVFWAIFVLLGIEKARIVPGITASNPLDLYYMPYTHSLIAAVAWSGLAFAAYRFIPTFKGSTKAALILAGAVFSHWVLDLIVHRPDLPLYDDTLKMGFGLWNYPVVAFALEAAILFGGIVLYLRSTTSNSGIGKYGVALFGFIMLPIQATVFFGPPPPSDRAAALTALVLYVVFAWIASWPERKRIPLGNTTSEPTIQHRA
ncbi:MAG TPA: hypothetical protein VHE58_03130 [Burkholderiales bacterium]|nr:hypothetical protein [Burkholderiales bacterium]